jgi:hypothetical protein
MNIMKYAICKRIFVLLEYQLCQIRSNTSYGFRITSGQVSG